MMNGSRAFIAFAVAIVINLIAYPLLPATAQSDDKLVMAPVWKLTFELSESEFRALEPTPPAIPAFGGPTGPSQPGTPRFGQPSGTRETVANFMGLQFPWVSGTVKVVTGKNEQAYACRLRYDGDFTYIMSGGAPNRPLYLELLNGATLGGANAFRLHTMRFDSSMLREITTAHVYQRFAVPAPHVTPAEVHFRVGAQDPRYIGLYSAIEAVDQPLLGRYGVPASAAQIQIAGLNTLRYIGDDWSAYAPLFRSRKPLSTTQQKRLIGLCRLISETGDEEFASNIADYVDVDGLLRYLAATSFTSNLTGFSNIGMNDYIIVPNDESPMRFVAAEFETSLGGAVLSGTPQQLSELSLRHPYAGECLLVERLLAVETYDVQLKQLAGDALDTFFHPSAIHPQLATFRDQTIDARARESEAAIARQTAGPLGGGAVGGQGAGGFGQPPQAMSPEEFITRRHSSLLKQITGSAEGYVPKPPDFGGFGGPPRQQGATAPITEDQFAEEVQVPVGFTASLYGKSPEVNYPVAIAAEPFGAIYVASDEQGSLGTEKDGGKILRCVDSNGDGVMDGVTVFCRVDHVRGVLYRGGKVWVCHPPYLSVFHDDDGDGVADRSEQLVSGLTTELVDTRGGDHTTNGIRMGVDGWIYIGAGDYGVPNARGTDGSTVTLRGGGILRVRPDGTELELFSSGLRNPFDIAVTPLLDLFTRDNTNDGGGWDTRVSQLFDSAEYGYPRLFANFSDEIMPTLGSYGNGGGTGALYIEDDRWPVPYNQSLFTSDWGRSGVFHHPLNPDGPSFTINQDTFATIPRATGMDFDAAGNLYIASWWSGEASVHVGPHVGFVTCITPTGASQGNTLVLEQMNVDELVTALMGNNITLRLHAQYELVKRAQHPELIAKLRQAILDEKNPLAGKVAAIFAIKQTQGTKSHPFLIELLEHQQLREFAIRALTDRATELEHVNTDLLSEYLNDASPRVRAQTIVALGKLGDDSVALKLLPLVSSSNDGRPDAGEPNSALVIPHLALRALVRLQPIEVCLAELDGDQWRASLKVLRHFYDKRVVEALVDRLNTPDLPNEQRLECATTLIRLYQQERPYDGAWWGIRPDTTGPFYDSIHWDQSDVIAESLLAVIQASGPSDRERLKQELKRHQVLLPGLAEDSFDMSVLTEITVDVEAVDPLDPGQLGNMTNEQALEQTLAVKGDVTRGALLFRSRSCVACHTAATGEKPAGPHLAEIGKRYKPSELVESILRPSEKLAQGYETQAFVMDDGQIVTGFVVSEAGRRITVRDNQGRTYTLERDAIEERTRVAISSMPEGLMGNATPGMLADLIAYLQSL